MESVRDQLGKGGEEKKLGPSVVEEVLKLNHDAMSTSNALLMLIVAVFTMLIAYVIQTLRLRVTTKAWVFNDMVTGPGLALVVAGLITTTMIAIAWKKTGFQGRILIGFTALVAIGLGVWFGVTSGNRRDEWVPPTFNLNFNDIPGSAEQAVQFMLGLLVTSGVVVNFFTGRMRTDRLKINTVAFLSLVALVFFAFLFFHYLFSLVIRTMQEFDVRDSEYNWVYYTLATLGTLVAIVLVDRLASFILSMLSGSPVEFDGQAVDPMADLATRRTFSMLRWLLVLTIIVPATLVWSHQEGMRVPEGGNIVREWTWVVGGGLAVVAATLFLGIIATEILMISPSVYGVLSSLMVGVAVFIVGVGVVYWTDITAYALIALVGALALWYFTTLDQGNALLVGLMMSTAFVLVNTAGRAIADATERSMTSPLSYWARTGLYLIPVFLVAAAWLLRSFRSGTSYAVPGMFLIFCIMYTFLYNPAGFEDEYKPYLPDADRIQNMALEFVITAAIFVPMISVAKFIYLGADAVNVQLSGGRIPVAEGIAQFTVYTVMSLLAALLYNETQTSPTFKTIIVRGQTVAKDVYDLVTTDMVDGAAWGKLRVRN